MGREKEKDKGEWEQERGWEGQKRAAEQKDMPNMITVIFSSKLPQGLLLPNGVLIVG